MKRPIVPCWVDSEGCLLLPKRILNHFKVKERSVGVSFVIRDDGVVEMMVDELFLKLAGIY